MELRAYLDENFRFTERYLKEHLPEAGFRISESTYLACPRAALEEGLCRICEAANTKHTENILENSSNGHGTQWLPGPPERSGSGSRFASRLIPCAPGRSKLPDFPGDHVRRFFVSINFNGVESRIQWDPGSTSFDDVRRADPAFDIS